MKSDFSKSFKLYDLSSDSDWLQILKLNKFNS